MGEDEPNFDDHIFQMDWKKHTNQVTIETEVSKKLRNSAVMRCSIAREQTGSKKWRVKVSWRKQPHQPLSPQAL